jgi:putative endonuclease
VHRGSEKVAAGFLTFQPCHVERSETSLTISARMRNHDYWVYILTNKRCTTLYIGITNNIGRRLGQHRCGEVEGFTKRYHLNRLVWLERFRNVNDAIACEKKLKGWRRSRKIALIEQMNPRWFDLSDDWEQQPKFHDRPWETEEMIRDSSLRSE